MVDERNDEDADNNGNGLGRSGEKTREERNGSGKSGELRWETARLEEIGNTSVKENAQRKYRRRNGREVLAVNENTRRRVEDEGEG